MEIKSLSLLKIIWLHKIKKILGLPLDYKEYWDERYRAGFTSGAGSYGELATFKADTINTFIEENSVRSVIEFGCGDGNQLKLMHYPEYLGMDIAPAAVEKCRKTFSGDDSKSFNLYSPESFSDNGSIHADLVVCLDVLYHIIPENDYIKTLDDIFSRSENFVILYTDIDMFKSRTYHEGAHVRHRDTLSYLKKYQNFTIDKIIPNKYPDLTFAVFIILKRDRETSSHDRAVSSGIQQF